MPGVLRTADQRILLAARDLMAARGVRRVSVEDVAQAAGVTRVTIYRHFRNRESLVRAAFLNLADALEALIADLGDEPRPDVDAFLARIGEIMTSLPGGLQAAMADVQRVYPAVYAEVRDRERAAIAALFDRLYSGAEAQGRIRPGLKRPVVEMLFWQVVAGFLDYAALQNEGLSPVEVYRTIVDVLLNGMLVGPAEAH
jgi:AcrR family transcriptional regulator